MHPQTMLVKSPIAAALAVVAMLLGAMNGLALTAVTIDPNGHPGGYRLYDYPVSVSIAGLDDGVRNFNLADDNYLIDIGGSTADVVFNVAAGVVTSANPGVTVVGTTITFNTTAVTVDPSGYAAGYRLYDSPVSRQIYALAGGVRNFTLVNGDYLLDLGGPTSDAGFSLSGGTVSSGNPSLSIVGTTITLNTASITIDPAGYPAGYRVYDYPVSRQIEPLGSGVRNTVLPDGDYVIDLGGPGSDVVFTVSGGTVSSANPSVIAAGTTITLLNTTVTVDPAGFAGQYRLYDYPVSRQIEGLGSGVRNFSVPDGDYVLDMGGPASDVVFTVSGGTVSSLNPAVTAAAATITFNTSTVQVAPNGHPGQYRLYDYPVSRQLAGLDTGPRFFSLVDGDYLLDIGDSVADAIFTVLGGVLSTADPGLTVGNTTVTFVTHVITVDPDGVTDSYRLYDNPVSRPVVTTGSGVRSFALIDGNYRFDFVTGPADFNFTVDGGTVSYDCSALPYVGGYGTAQLEICDGNCVCVPCATVTSAVINSVCGGLGALPSASKQSLQQAIRDAFATELGGSKVCCDPPVNGTEDCIQAAFAFFGL